MTQSQNCMGQQQVGVLQLSQRTEAGFTLTERTGSWSRVHMGDDENTLLA